MRVSTTIKLKNEFISDIDFIHYQDTYNNQNVIDKDLLLKKEQNIYIGDTKLLAISRIKIVNH